MNGLGQQIADQTFPQANSSQDSTGRGTIYQTFNTSDLSLKNSLLFGGKLGYFFKDEGLSWLGVELEAFHSTPTIKAQNATFNQTITFQPNTPSQNPSVDCVPPPGGPAPTCPGSVITSGSLEVPESTLRLTTVAFNLVARYPGQLVQPYAGVGVGAFYFSSSTGSVQGSQVVPGLNALAGLKFLATEEWGLFLEGKYNLAAINNLGTIGLSGTYSAFNLLAGVAYHF
jgi:opacity protein-like surface antigen